MKKLRTKPIRTNGDNSFAHTAMTIRLPDALRMVQKHNTYPDWINARLDHLYAEVTQNWRIAQLESFAPDAGMWFAEVEKRSGETWLDTEWFFAETYFFRRLIEAVRWWETGRDPYRPIKALELNDATLEMVKDALSFDGNRSEKLEFLLERALWGNRADLSHPQALAQGQHIRQDDLLIDDRKAAVKTILHGSGSIHIVCDNFGGELAMDLVLVEYLIKLGIPILLHLKMWPTYISDATVDDFHWMLGWMRESDDFQANVLAKRLTMAFENGMLRLAPDLYWNSNQFLSTLPDHIRDCIKQGRLLILKGDANYRRAVNDTIYPVDMAFDRVIADRPIPVLALRTLKSDPIVGLDRDTAKQLQQIDPDWRTNGQRGVIQYVDS